MSACMNCTFRIGYCLIDTTAIIHTGYSFASCVSESFSENLGFSQDQLQKSPIDLVKQAGGGAQLQIVRILPSLFTIWLPPVILQFTSLDLD